jgi:hypothetical protein
MRRKDAFCLAMALLGVMTTAAPAPAANVGDGCVGSAVASVAHFTQQGLDLGFGDYFHSIDQVPGQSIRAHSAEFCSREGGA